MMKNILIIGLIFMASVCWAEDYIEVTSSGGGLDTTAGDARYVKTNNASAYNNYVFPNTDGAVNQVLKTSGAGVLTWSADNDSGAGTGVDNNLDNLRGHFTGKILQVGGLGTAGVISSNTVTANTVSFNSIVTSKLAADSISANTVTGNTISGNTINVAGAYSFPRWDGANGQVLKTDTSGVLYWAADNDSGGSGVNNNLDNLTGHYTTKILQIGGMGTSGTVSASTVSSGTVIGGRGYFDILGGVNVTGNTVSGNIVRTGAFAFPTTDGSNNQVLKTNGSGVLTWQADNTSAPGSAGLSSLTDYNTANVLVVGGIGTAGTVSGGTVSGNSIVNGFAGNKLTDYSTIQFTIASPDTLDEQSRLLIWSNDTNKTFNIVSVQAWSDATYNTVMNKMTLNGGFDGGLFDFNTKQNATMSVTTNTITSVSASTITNSTVIYLDPNISPANYIKVTLKGYYS